MIKEIKNAFKDVDRAKAPDKNGTIGGQNYLNNVKSLRIGSGDESIKMDESGIWTGAKKFEDAPARISIDGIFTGDIQDSDGNTIIDDDGFNSSNAFNSFEESSSVGTATTTSTVYTAMPGPGGVGNLDAGGGWLTTLACRVVSTVSLDLGFTSTGAGTGVQALMRRSTTALGNGIKISGSFLLGASISDYISSEYSYESSLSASTFLTTIVFWKVLNASDTGHCANRSIRLQVYGNVTAA